MLVNDIRNLSTITVASWGIETRPAKAADAKTYYYVATDKTFESEGAEFDYDNLDKKGKD